MISACAILSLAAFFWFIEAVFSLKQLDELGKAPVAKNTTGGFSFPAVPKVIERKGRRLVRSYSRRLTSRAGNGTGSTVAHPLNHDEDKGVAGAELVYQDTLYVTTVSIGRGENATDFQLVFDTGSSDFWVLADEVFVSVLSLLDGNNLNVSNESLRNAVNVIQGPRATYNRGRSEGWQRDLSFQIGYGVSTASDSESISGEVFIDQVTIGGYSVEMHIGAVTQVSSHFTLPPGQDGILAMGFCTGNTVTPTRVKGFLEHVMTQLPTGVFTADLYTSGNTAGTFDFGFIDESKFPNGTMKYVCVDPSFGGWEFNVTGGFTVREVHYDDFGYSVARVDTGAELIYISMEAAQRYWAAVPGTIDLYANYPYLAQSYWVFPCETLLPDLWLPFGNNSAFIPGYLINLFEDGVHDGIMYCIGALQGYVSDTGKNIYGSTFLRAGFAVFDYENTRFGFAPKIREPPPKDHNKTTSGG